MLSQASVMNLAVTGGAGFIGSHLTEYLVKQGHSVTVIDNLHAEKIENLKNIRNKIDFRQIDILDFEELKNIVKDVDGIFHEAALISLQESLEKPEEYHKVNVIGTENIFKLAKQFGFKVVFASSSSVYGNVEKIPINEDFKKNPVNPYAQTKLKSERLAEKYTSLGVRIIGLRYFNVYGKGQSIAYAGVITKFMERIANHLPPIINGDGSQVRDFVYVGDVAEANFKAIQSNVDFGFFNIGTGKSVPILELANMMILASGLSLEPVFSDPLKGDIKASEADINLAKRLLNWKPKTELKDWINDIVPNILKSGFRN